MSVQPTSGTELTGRQLCSLNEDELSRSNVLDLNDAIRRELASPSVTANPADSIAKWTSELQQAGLRYEAVSRSDRESYWLQVVSLLEDRLKLTLVDVPAASKEPADVFLAIGITERRLTTHTLPILLKVMADRIRAPLGLVLDNDRLICRIEGLGEAPINLAFTEKGVQKRSDKDILASRGRPASTTQPSAEVKPLTNRELLAWFIGQRSAIRMAGGDLAGAEQDLLLARSVFPDNRALFIRGVRLTELRGPQILGSSLWATLQGRPDPAAPARDASVPRTPEEVMQFNARNRPASGVPDPKQSLPTIPRPPSPLDRYGQREYRR